MKSLVLIALLFCSCTTLRPPEAPDTLPELIYQVPLPPWPTTAFVQGSTLELMLRVTSDGSVHSAHLLTPTGYTDWDSLALEVIRQWRFSPARMGTQPIPCWIQQKVRVRFEPPEPMVLAELVCSDRSRLDSLYVLLMEGTPFDSLARIHSVAASRDKGGFLGEIDARSFPAHVRRRLTALQVGDITNPLILGRNVAIFKRLGRIR
jgi:TonB family protein